MVVIMFAGFNLNKNQFTPNSDKSQIFLLRLD